MANDQSIVCFLSSSFFSLFGLPMYFFHTRSFKEYTWKFYIKTTFQDSVVLQYKLLCRQENVLMLFFVTSSPSDIPCPIKLLSLFSAFRVKKKKNWFRFFGISGCYHPLKLHVVFHTTFIILSHIYTHLTPTSLSYMWSETLCSMKCSSTKLLALISHSVAQKLQVSTRGRIEEFKLITIAPTSCLSCLKTNVFYPPFNFFFFLIFP